MDAVFSPDSSFVIEMYSPLSVVTILMSFSSHDCDLRNPRSAPVGAWVVASYAAFVCGPRASIRASACLSSSPSIMKVSLLGVPRVRIPLNESLFASMFFLSIAERRSRALGMNEAGISSVPISSKRSFGMVSSFFYV